MIKIFLIFVLFSASLYCIILFWMHLNFDPDQNIEIYTQPTQTVSLIIACRNEEENILNLLESIQHLEYSEEFLQVIFVDDNSADATFQLLEKNIYKVKFKTKLLKISNGTPSKKFAIDHAVNNSEAEIIITTDADCKLPADLIIHHAKVLSNKKNVASLGYVAIEKNNGSFLNYFQIFEMQALQIFTYCFAKEGYPIMSNGANFAYRRNAFINVSGYEGNMQINSGDDVFLLHKFNSNYKSAVKYALNPNSVVYTKPLVDFRGFLSQRLRWASKSAYYTDKATILTGLLVLFANLSMFFLYIFSFFSIILAKVLVGYFVVRILLEFLLLQKSYRIEKRNMNLIWFLLFAIVYPVYSIVMAIVAPVSKIVWKGVPVK